MWHLMMSVKLAIKLRHVHYTYVKSQQQLMVTDIQGVDYTLCDPEVASSELSRLQHSIVVTRLARESGGPNSILTPWKIKLFSFSFLSLHVYFNVQRILSVPTSQNTEILCRFPTMNYQMLTHLISL